MKFRVTESWLRQFARGGRGWTRQQIECLGIRYPQKHGWIERIVGCFIDQSARERFELLHLDKVACGNQTPQKSRNGTGQKKRPKNRKGSPKGKRPSGARYSEPNREKVWFGKYRGRPWENVPTEYLQWMFRNFTEDKGKTAARIELRRRGINVPEHSFCPPLNELRSNHSEFPNSSMSHESDYPEDLLAGECEIDRELREIVGVG